MIENVFNWEKAKQFSIAQILLAIFLPSAFAFVGFRVVLPIIHKNGVPAIIAWPAIASVMLLVFVVFAISFLRAEAKKLNISLKARMCFKSLTKKQWLISIGLLFFGLIVTMILSKASIYLTNLPGFSVPGYFPFILNPTIDPMKIDPALLTPGLVLKGAYWLIPLMVITLFLNILTEELYFRAWLLPKMNNYGKASWIINGTLFAFYHTFQLWLIPQILPISLFMAYVVYKSKSIWPAFTIHIIVNLLTVMGMLSMIVAK